MKSKSARFVFFLLAFWLAGCGLLGTQEYKADDSIAAFTFDYPADWEIVYNEDGSVQVYEDVENMEIQQIGGADSVIVYKQTPGELSATYQMEQISPLAILQQTATAAETQWAAITATE
jgi:hypothetical protein